MQMDITYICRNGLSGVQNVRIISIHKHKTSDTQSELAKTNLNKQAFKECKHSRRLTIVKQSEKNSGVSPNKWPFFVHNRPI